MSTLPGSGSPYLVNSKLSPARLQTLEKQGIDPIVIPFDIVGNPGAFSDHTTANYNIHGYRNAIFRWAQNAISRRASNFYKGELTNRFDSVSPQFLHFEIFLRADRDFSSEDIIDRITKLKSLMYPKIAIGGNPPLCRLLVLNLYSLEVYVQDVTVNWHNTWNLREDLPMGASLDITVFNHQYLTREEVLRGGAFKSIPAGGYAGTPGQTPGTQQQADTLAGTNLPGVGRTKGAF